MLWTKTCIHYYHTAEEKSYIQAFSMFIIFIKQQIQLQIWNRQEYLSYEEVRPVTSYVTAMFHLTIGQCAHQSLSNTATPELGMIPTRNKGTLVGSHIAKDMSKSSQAKTTFWFIRFLKRWNGWIAKLVSSTTELWTPTHPTQGSIPFSATQSLRLCLPFQCSLGCARKNNHPHLICLCGFFIH